MKILIIEASTLVRDGVKSLLEIAQHEVCVLDPSAAGLQSVIDCAPDLVIIEPDDLPDNGAALVHQIKTCSLPIKVC